jgi:hypothetical protein
MSIQIAYPEAEIADIQKLPKEIWLPPIVGERQRSSRGTASGNPWFSVLRCLFRSPALLRNLLPENPSVVE